MPFFGVPIRNGLPIGLGSVAGFGVQQFDPSLLFEGGTIPGAWYDPSDLTTMFTTSAGTTPVAMPGQGSAVSVGLMLDKSQGLVLGPELVTNGTFDTNTTGWSVLGVATFVSVAGQGVLTVTSGSFWAGQSFSVTSGKWYEIRARFVTKTAASVAFFRADPSAIGGTGYVSVSPTVDNTDLVYRVLASSATMYVAVGVNANGYSSTWDNISVRELPGNHAIAINNTTARPELRARVNLLTYSEEFSNAAWKKENSTAANTTATLDPLGGTTADVYTNTAAGDWLNTASAITIVAGLNYTFSVYAKRGTQDWLRLSGWNDVTGTGSTQAFNAWFNLATGVKGTLSSGADGTAVSHDMVSVGNGWYRCTVTGRSTALTTLFPELNMTTADAVTTRPVTGNEVYIWGADLRPANIGANVPAYQRIADANTYDTNGFPLYLRFDGIDDGMYTPANLDFATVTSDGQARRNLLNNPTQFDVNTVWTATNATVTANNATAPDGTLTADTLTSSGIAAAQRVGQNTTQTGQVTFSIYAKAGTAQFLQILNAADGNCFANFDLATAQTGTKGTGATSTITVDSSGWCRCTITFTLGSAAQWYVYLAPSASATYGQSFTATVAAFSVWGAQLETGSTATAFQNIGTDKVGVFAGVRKLSDAARGNIVELSASADTNNGSFVLVAPNTTTTNRFAFVSKGTNIGAANATGVSYDAPVSVVTAAIGSIGNDEATIRINGNQAAQSTADQGTGNYGTYPLYIGSRNNSILWFNGHLHGLIIAGSAVSAGNISATENWMAGKTGIQI